MSDQVIAKELHPGVWEWCICSDQSTATGRNFHSGDGEALAAFLPSASTPVNVVMRGQQVVATEVELDAKQKKHAAKLIPFELEEELSSSVDNLHFAFGQFAENRVPVLYAEKESCEGPLSDLGAQGCDVRVALPDYLMLRRSPNGVTILSENNFVSVRLSEHWGFTIELALASVLFERITQHSALKDNPPEEVLLVAENETDIAVITTWLPSEWLEDDTISVDVIEGGFWDCVDTSVSAVSLNLRRGRFARQLPFGRWWRLWKAPAIVLGVAFFVAILVQVAGFYFAKNEGQQVREKMNEVYLQAVPNGRLGGDLERLLESKLKSQNTASSEPTNFMFLLSQVTGVIAADDKTTLSSFSYSGDQRSLQLTLEFDSLSSLAEFRSTLQQRGVASDSPRTTSVGDKYQARIKIREAK